MTPLTPLTPQPGSTPTAPGRSDRQPDGQHGSAARVPPNAAPAGGTGSDRAVVRGALDWHEFDSYERELGWTVDHGDGDGPPHLLTGRCFDALWLPAAAGLPLLARRRRTGPALRAGTTVWLLVAEGSAGDLPGLLQWLGWGTLGPELGLGASGADGRVPAPPLGRRVARRWEAAWLRPPTAAGVRLTLPVLSFGGPTTAPDLRDLVAAAATECHRALLRRPRPGTRSAPRRSAREPSAREPRARGTGTEPTARHGTVVGTPDNDNTDTTTAGPADQLPAFS